jgi:hypothetical protein
LIALDAIGSTSARFAAFQFIGILASFGVCGAAVLLDNAGTKLTPMRNVVPIAAVCAVLILVRLPRTVSSLKTYVFRPPVTQIFKLADFDAISTAVGSGGVLMVDVHDQLEAIAVLVELGRRGIKLQWSPDSWKTTFGYREWAVPKYEVAATLVLDGKNNLIGELGRVEPTEVVYEGVQYRLRRPSAIRP